jgi:hypothetical protein
MRTLVAALTVALTLHMPTLFDALQYVLHAALTHGASLCAQRVICYHLMGRTACCPAVRTPEELPWPCKPSASTTGFVPILPINWPSINSRAFLHAVHALQYVRLENFLVLLLAFVINLFVIGIFANAFEGVEEVGG